MNSTAQRRLQKDLMRLMKEQPEGVDANPLDDNLFVWEGFIEGPVESPWEGGIFKLKLQFSNNYPNEVPKVEFVTKMFHPNIYHDGRICLDILKEKWSSIYDVMAILTAIRALLTDPNPNSPANNEVAELFVKNPKEY